MNNILEMRQEIHTLIDNMAERNLYALRPLLDVLVDNTDDDVLSDDEVKLLEECRTDRKKQPENFTPWETVKKELKLI